MQEKSVKSRSGIWDSRGSPPNLDFKGKFKKARPTFYGK